MLGAYTLTSSNIVEHLGVMRASGLASVLYFYFDFNDIKKQSRRALLSSLLVQLGAQPGPFCDILSRLYSSHDNGGRQPSDDRLMRCLGEMLSLEGQGTIYVIIDALDECGNTQSRPRVLRVLTDAATLAPWLKIIITSRPEDDIEKFFNAPSQLSYRSYDLVTDLEASADLRTFAQRQFELVAETLCLSTPWPEKLLFDQVISRANGLFIFIKTLVLALEKCEDPEKSLKETVQGPASTGLESLYDLYSTILKARIVHSYAEFRRVIGVLLTTTPLCEETIAGLAGVRPDLAKKWVKDLSSLLYRDEGANGAIRVRHLSISDYFLSDHCDHQVKLQDANVQLGIACLKTMVDQLCFNICELEDSRLANAEVKDLETRIEQNISDALQYSSLYWSNHLCFTPDNRDERVWGSLKGLFEGLCPLFWIEVLSIMGMVPTGAPSLRRVISWAKVSTALVRSRFGF